jgi:hypothetical protein
MSRKKITGRDREMDAAEAWLANNDPEYDVRKRDWQTPSTDALARDRDEHPTLTEIHPIGEVGHGSYRKWSAGHPAGSRKFKHDLLRQLEPKNEQSDG